MDATKLTAQEQERENAKFSFSGATLYGINAVIGSGIFLLPQKIYKGLGPASLAVMLGTALLVILLAVCLAETAGYFNKNGGAFQYSKAAFGDFVGFNVGFLGWAVTIIAWSAMAAGFARLFVITFKSFAPYELLLSVSLIILLSLMNISGLKTSKMFTLTATVAKLIPIVAFSLCAIFFIKAAPSGYQPTDWKAPVQTKQGPANKNWKEMLQSPLFYIIISMFFVGAFSGLMIASQASPIGQSMFGLSAGTAALYVSLYSIANSSGRFIWGSLSDKIGRSQTLLIIYSVIVLALFSLTIIPGQLGFTLGILGLGICFGGVMGVFPSIVMENYGPTNQGVNYGIVFTGYSLAAFFAPKVAVQMAAANNGNYSAAFYVAIALAVVGLLLNLLYMKKKG